MAGLSFDFRKAAIALAIVGGIMGVAFGVGVAYGRGSPKTVDSGMSQAQIQQLLGLGSGGGASLGGGSSTSGGFGGGGGGGAGGGLSALLGGGTAGVVTAVTSNSITIETRQGTHTVNISPSTNVQTYSKSAASALKAGDAVIVSGETGSDGAIAATAISQLPEELKGLASGTGFGGGASGASGASGAGGRSFGNGGANGATGASGGR